MQIITSRSRNSIGSTGGSNRVRDRRKDLIFVPHHSADDGVILSQARALGEKAIESLAGLVSFRHTCFSATRSLRRRFAAK